MTDKEKGPGEEAPEPMGTVENSKQSNLIPFPVAVQAETIDAPPLKAVQELIVCVPAHTPDFVILESLHEIRSYWDRSLPIWGTPAWKFLNLHCRLGIPRDTQVFRYWPGLFPPEPCAVVQPLYSPGEVLTALLFTYLDPVTGKMADMARPRHIWGYAP